MFLKKIICISALFIISAIYAMDGKEWKVVQKKNSEKGHSISVTVPSSNYQEEQLISQSAIDDPLERLIELNIHILKKSNIMLNNILLMDKRLNQRLQMIETRLNGLEKQLQESMIVDNLFAN